MEIFRKILVIIGGINFLLFGLYHLSFWGFPEWKSELIKLTELIGNYGTNAKYWTVSFLIGVWISYDFFSQRDFQFQIRQGFTDCFLIILACKINWIVCISRRVNRIRSNPVFMYTDLPDTSNKH